MDDEVIGCGGLMLLHTDKRRVHCLYASNGAKSPWPLLPWQDRPPRNLTDLRKREAGEALSEIGIPRQNMTFLDLPDGGLGRVSAQLRENIANEINRLEPDFIFVPFRYDLHSDHVAAQRAVRYLARHGRIKSTVLEYFVYVRWALVSGGDIRQRIRQDRLTTIDVSSVAARKHKALTMYRSQTEMIFRWQDSPVLTADSVRQRCEQPEHFLLSSATEPLAACFSADRHTILLAHYAQRFGKRRKDQLVALCKGTRRSAAREAATPIDRE
jgi:LmbE family N-acetylglucosaminyl deacetylase